MAYQELTGNLFNSKARAFVNTVNCVGAMGKGIALEFRRRYPDMYLAYKRDCSEGKIIPGRIYAYPQPSGLLILNFAIKDDWKQPSKIEWIESCLRQFVAGYRKKGITTIAFPWMGAQNGGIPFDQIQRVTRHYLQNLKDIDIEVYTFDPDASDPLFETLTQIASIADPLAYVVSSGMQRKAYIAVMDAVRERRASSLARLIELRVVGDSSIDRLYAFLMKISLQNGPAGDPQEKEEGKQLPLF